MNEPDLGAQAEEQVGHGSVLLGSVAPCIAELGIGQGGAQHGFGCDAQASGDGEVGSEPEVDVHELEVMVVSCGLGLEDFGVVGALEGGGEVEAGGNAAGFAADTEQGAPGEGASSLNVSARSHFSDEVGGTLALRGLFVGGCREGQQGCEGGDREGGESRAHGMGSCNHCTVLELALRVGISVRSMVVCRAMATGSGRVGCDR